MISHIHLGVSDYQRALVFYAAVMHELGLTLKFADPEKQWAAWMEAGKPRPLFIIGTPYEGMHDAGNGQMIALLAASRALVDRVHASALAHGARCDGPPGLRPQYHANYYGAYFRDPDGNKLCIVCHEPE